MNFVFHIEMKTKSNDKTLNFVFQFIKNTKWHFGYTDLDGIDTDDNGNLTDSPRLLFIEKECGNLLVVNDGEELS